MQYARKTKASSLAMLELNASAMFALAAELISMLKVHLVKLWRHDQLHWSPLFQKISTQKFTNDRQRRFTLVKNRVCYFMRL